LNSFQEAATPRDMAAVEIWTTELTYCTNLEKLTQTWLPGLKEICSPEDIKTIFSNVEVLLNFSTKLAHELESRIVNWTPNQMVGDIFLKFVSTITCATN
jgi:hypothetical protein